MFLIVQDIRQLAFFFLSFLATYTFYFSLTPVIVGSRTDCIYLGIQELVCVWGSALVIWDTTIVKGLDRLRFVRLTAIQDIRKISDCLQIEMPHKHPYLTDTHSDVVIVGVCRVDISSSLQARHVVQDRSVYMVLNNKICCCVACQSNAFQSRFVLRSNVRSPACQRPLERLTCRRHSDQIADTRTETFQTRPLKGFLNIFP